MPDNPFDQSLKFNVDVQGVQKLTSLTSAVQKLQQAVQSHGAAKGDIGKLVQDLGALKNLNLNNVQIPANLGRSLKALMEGFSGINPNAAAGLRGFVGELNKINTGTFVTRMRDLNRAFAQMDLTAAQNAARAIEVVGESLKKYDKYISAAASRSAIMGAASSLRMLAGRVATTVGQTTQGPAAGAGAGAAVGAGAADLVSAAQLNQLIQTIAGGLGADPKNAKALRLARGPMKIASISIKHRAKMREIEAQAAAALSRISAKEGPNTERTRIRADVQKDIADLKATNAVTLKNIDAAREAAKLKGHLAIETARQAPRNAREANRATELANPIYWEAQRSTAAWNAARAEASRRKGAEHQSTYTLGLQKAQRNLDTLPINSPGGLESFVQQDLAPVFPILQSLLGATTPSGLQGNLRKMVAVGGYPGVVNANPLMTSTAQGETAGILGKHLSMVAAGQGTNEAQRAFKSMQDAIDRLTKVLEQEIQVGGAQAAEARKALEDLTVGRTPAFTGSLAHAVAPDIQQVLAAQGAAARSYDMQLWGVAEQPKSSYVALNTQEQNAIARANSMGQSGTGSLSKDLAMMAAERVGLGGHVGTFRAAYTLVHGHRVRAVQKANQSDPQAAATAVAGMSRIPSAVGAAGIGVGLLALGGLTYGAVQNIQLSNSMSPLYRQLHGGISGFQSWLPYTFTGAKYGYTLQQSQQAYSAYANSAGLLGGSVRGAMSYLLPAARSLGVSPELMASTAGSVAAMQGGLNPKRFAEMIGTAVTEGFAKGRAGEILQALTTTMAAVQTSLVSPSSSATMAQLAALGQTNPALVGSTGAALLSQIQSGMGSPGMGGAGQLLNMRLLNRSGMNLYQLLFSEAAGPTYTPPGSSRSNLQLALSRVRSMTGVTASQFSGKNYYPLTGSAGMAEQLLKGMWGISLSSAGALLSMNPQQIQQQYNLMKSGKSSLFTPALTPQEQVVSALQTANAKLAEISGGVVKVIGPAVSAIALAMGAVPNGSALSGMSSMVQYGKSHTSWYGSSTPRLGAGVGQWRQSINQVAMATGLPPALLAGIMQQESGGVANPPPPFSYNKSGQLIGVSEGLMQINLLAHPNFAKQFGLTAAGIRSHATSQQAEQAYLTAHGLYTSKGRYATMMEAAKILNGNLSEFHGNLRTAVQAYYGAPESNAAINYYNRVAQYVAAASNSGYSTNVPLNVSITATLNQQSNGTYTGSTQTTARATASTTGNQPSSSTGFYGG